MSIHPTAIVDPSAKIAEDVNIGPFCVIESDTIIESGCEIAARVTIKSGVCMGANCKVHENAVIGGIGQHVCPPGAPGKVRIGSNNTFREFCTVQRSIKEDGFTVIGNGNYFMVNSHIAHDCIIGNNNIVANNVMFGGHVHVGNRAFVSGGVAVHQFCSIGSYVNTIKRWERQYLKNGLAGLLKEYRGRPHKVKTEDTKVPLPTKQIKNYPKNFSSIRTPKPIRNKVTLPASNREFVRELSEKNF